MDTRAAFAARSEHVRHVLVPLGNTRGAQRDSDLPSGQSDYYSLDTMTRLECDPRVMRSMVVDAIGEGYITARDRMPCVRPVIVASIKPCFLPDARNHARVALDLDVAGDGAGALFPEPDVLASVVVGWANEFLEGVGDFEEEPMVVLMGAFQDKFCSAHVIFPSLTWVGERGNLLKNNLRAIGELDEALAPFGLKADTTITSSGLKLPFCNKRLKDGSYRDAVQVVASTYNIEEPLTYGDLYELCDGVVHADEAPAQRKVSFRVLSPLRTRARGAEHRPAVHGGRMVRADGDTVDERLLAAVPEWRGAQLRRLVKAEGVTVIIPQTTSCPLKTVATDTPAGEHGSAGKGYAVVLPDGTIKVRCHICSGNELTIESTAQLQEHEADLIPWFNSRYCKLNGDSVLEYGVRLNDGSISEHRVMSHHIFHASLLHLPKIKIGNKNKAQSQLWLESPHATMCPLGCICDPSETNDPRYFNTWRGFDRRVLEVHETMKEMSDEALLEECKHFRHLLTHNICAGDEASVDYVFNWLASMFQKPGEKCRTALIVTGKPGSGKGLVGQYIMKIVGHPHGIQVDSKALVDRYNYAIADAVFLFCDEATATHDPHATSTLKALITEETQTVRRKYRDDIVGQKNFHHVYMASNFAEAVDWQKGERRFVAMKGDFRVFPNHTPEWKAMVDQVVEERESLRGPAALYTLLMRADISGWNPQDIPSTGDAWSTHYESLSVYSKYIYRVLCNGDIIYNYDPQATDLAIAQGLLDEAGFRHKQDGTRDLEVAALGTDVFNSARRNLFLPKKIMTEGLKSMYEDLGRNPDAGLWRYLYQLLPEHRWNSGRKTVAKGVRAQCFKMPPLEDLKEAFLNVEGERDARIFSDWKI